MNARCICGRNKKKRNGYLGRIICYSFGQIGDLGYKDERDDYMEIKASAVFDYKGIKAFSHAIAYKKLGPKFYFFFLTILPAFMILFLLWAMRIHMVKIYIYFLVFFIAAIIYGCFVHFGCPRLQYRAHKKMHELGAVTEYIFCDELIKITSNQDRCNVCGEAKYDLFIKVIETSDYLFLFLKKDQALVVDKATIVNGSIDDIRQKFLPHLKKKYYIYKY